MDKFVSLHSHSHYSVLDGLNSPEEMARNAALLGQPGLAITDHGTLSGHREFQKACAKHDIKPILGVEAYISATDRFDRRKKGSRKDGTDVYNHIILLAKNQRGVENLHTLSRTAWNEGFYYNPRIDWELLDQYGDNLIVLSGCMSGLISDAILKGNFDVAEEWADKLKARFADDFYIEVQAHNSDYLNDGLVRLAAYKDITVVATTDCHFNRPEDRWVEEAMLILATRPKPKGTYSDVEGFSNPMEAFDKLYPERGMSFADIDVYMQTRQELLDSFTQSMGEGPLDATGEIYAKIGEYDFPEGMDLLPKVSDNPDLDLEEMVKTGLSAKDKVTAEYVERAKFELSVIQEKNFSNYFLIVKDIVDWCKAQSIPVGRGRGSAAGSLVCYALDITLDDPLEYGLLFERFLDLERNDFPDVDLDISRKGRPRAYEYLREKYGYVASISNFVYLQEKNAIKDAASVYRVPFSVVNRALSKVDTWDEFMETEDEEASNFRVNYPEVMALAERLRGRIRSSSIHAAGVIISNSPIEEIAPMETRKSPDDLVDGRIPVVAWDMTQCEAAGFIKLDLLGLKTLDVIDDAVRFIAETRGEEIDIDNVPATDLEVFKELSAANTLGGFQVEGHAYRGLMEEMTINNFSDLVASNALVRPGARETIGDSYIKRQKGIERASSYHPEVDGFLSETHQLPLYQEQIMQMAQTLGGMSKAESNQMRRVMAKKKDPELLAPFRRKFLENAGPKLGQGGAAVLWDIFEQQTKYSFNKSHSVSYSMTSYHTMWLKTHYPLEYMAALYRNEDDLKKRPYIILEMNRLGIEWELPDITRSEAYATIDNGKIVMGLTDAKYVSPKVYNNIRKIMDTGEIKTVADFVEHAARKYSGVNKGAIAALSAVDAFRGLRSGGHVFEAPGSTDVYDYLGVPSFDTTKIAGVPESMLTPLNFIDENSSGVVRAMCVNIKSGKAKSGREWTRADFLDESGEYSGFLDAKQHVEKGKMYVLVVMGSSVMKAVAVEDVPDDDTFMAYFSPTSRRGYMVLGLSELYTKKKDLMAHVLLARGTQLYKSLVFPSSYAEFGSKIFDGAGFREVEMRPLEDGTQMIIGVEH